MSKEILFHGSSRIVERPELSRGSVHNDYGRGFYCTGLEEMAKEWACKDGKDGYVNRYELETEGLRLLDLSAHTALNWIALLLKHRTFRLRSPIASDAREYLIRRFAPDTAEYDVIEGYRADDSYFQYAESFVENTLSLRGLSRALTLGKLGMQTVLVSGKAFRQIAFIGAEPAEAALYYPKFAERDSRARRAWSEEIAGSRSYRSDIFVLDILREEMTSDDPRLQ